MRTSLGARGAMLALTILLTIAGQTWVGRAYAGDYCRLREISLGVVCVESTFAEAPGPIAMVSSTSHDALGRPLTATSPLGAVTTWTWSGPYLGSLTVSASGRSSTTEFSYDGSGQTTGVAVKAGGVLTRTAATQYDPAGTARRVQMTAADGSAAEQVSCARYAADGRVLETISPEGERARYLYHTDGQVRRVLRGLFPPDPTSAWDDDCPVKLPPVSLPGGGGGGSSLLGATDFVWGEVSRVEYDLNGRPVALFDARGQQTSIVYDGFSRPIKILNGSGGERQMGYDASGSVVWTADYDWQLPPSPPLYGRPQGAPSAGLHAASEMTYDEAGRLKTASRWHFDENRSPIGDGRATTTWSYDDLARTVTVTDDNDRTTTRISDRLGRVIKVVYPIGDVETYEYSADGHEITHSAATGTTSVLRTERLTLNDWGARHKLEANVKGAWPLLAEWRYDNLFRLTEAWGPAGLPLPADSTRSQKLLGYDAFGRVTTTTTRFGDQGQELVKLVYDRDDRVVERRSNAGGTAVPDAVTKTSWDALGRLKRLDRPENVWEEYSYEGASPLPLSRLDGRQISTAWQYTATGQVKRVGAGGVDTTQWLYRDFTYDALGRLIEARDNGSTADATDDVVTWLRWDSLGGKRKEWSSVLGESLAIQHSFDGTGALVASVLGSTSVSWSRDELGRLKSLWAGFISGGPDVQLTYDGLGGPATRIYGNGNKTSFTYDELGQLIELGDTNQQNVKFAGWSWQVPIDGVPRTARFHRGWTATMSAYVNDGGDRLMIEDHGIAPPVVPATITASTSGYAANVATAQYLKTGKGLGPTGWGSGGAGQAWRAYKLDGRSNWVQRAGGLAALNVAPTLNLLDAYKAFQSPISYNADGSVKSVGSSEAYTYNALGELTDVQVGALKKHYTYDALGRRVSEASIAGSVTTPTRYGYDGPRRTLRLLPGQSLPEVTVDGDGLDQHLMRITPSGAKQYYHQDRSNSVYLVTDANGAPLEWYQYTAYGEMTVLSANGLAISASAIGNRFGYQGQPFDLDTGLVDMRARFYRPGWGRFVQPDPIGFAGGSNLFGFVGSAPMKWWDPMGLDRDNFRSSPFDAGVPENELHTTQEGAGVDNLIPGTPCEDVGDCELPTWLTKGTYPFRFVLGAGFDSVAGGLNGLFPGIAPNGPAFGHSNFFYGAQLISSSLGQATDYAAIGVGTAGAAGGGTAAVASGGTLALPGAALAAGGVAVAGAGYHMLPLHQNAAQDAWDNLFRKDGDDSNSGSGSVWKMKEVEGLDGQPQRVYQRDDLIDPGLKDKYGRTNFSRMKQGLAPIGPDGIEINVHHMLQTADGPLAELTATFHRTLSKP